MAMPSGNIVMSDKMQFPVVGSGGMVGGVVGDLSGGVGGEIHPRQWFPDERDGFIMWMRGEFAASNAIIDSLCHHFRVVGDPGEYDAVFASIQQRRCNWNQVLHMQQYFSIAEVINSLQQVAWRRQQQQNRYFDPNTKGPGREFKRRDGFRQGHRMDSYKEWSVLNSDNRGHDINGSEKGEKLNEPVAQVKKIEDKGLGHLEDKKGNEADSISNTLANCCPKSSGNSDDNVYSNSGFEMEEVDDDCASKSKDNDSHAIQSQIENLKLTNPPKTFEATEIHEGKQVNIVDGLKLYKDLFSSSEVSKLVSLVNDLRAAGRKGQFQGHSFVVLKRPMKGHGREMIQFGVPISEASPEDETALGTCNERKIDSIPALLRDVLVHLVSMQVTTVKPDSCIIDIYNEGDYSQPHTWPPSYGRPICMMFLTECDLIFGRIIGPDQPGSGDYKGSLKLSLSPGSILVLQGTSADIAKHAIPSIRKQRILVTFTKSQPKRNSLGDAPRLPSPSPTPPAHWGPHMNRPSNHIRHHTGPKHYSPVPPTTGVLPAPPGRPQHAPQNGVQPVFITPAVAPVMPFPAPVALQPGSPWPAAPRHAPPPRLPVPGTGVFLPPPGSGNSIAPQHISSSTVTDTAGYSEGATNLPERENGPNKLNTYSDSPNGTDENDGKPLKMRSNGTADETGSIKTRTNEESQIDDQAALEVLREKES